MAEQLVGLDEAPEGLLDEIFSCVQVVEHVAAEDEESAVDPDVRLRDVLDAVHEAILHRANSVERVGLGRTQSNEPTLSASASSDTMAESGASVTASP